MQSYNMKNFSFTAVGVAAFFLDVVLLVCLVVYYITMCGSEAVEVGWIPVPFYGRGETGTGE